MESQFQHKKGDSFDYTLQIPLDFADGYFNTGWDPPDCKIKDAEGNDVAVVGGGSDDIVLAWNGATTRSLNILVIDTTAWDVGEGLVFDVQFTRTADSYVVSIDTVQFDVIADVT